MYGLAGYDAKKSESRDKSLVINWIKIGADITQVCHESYAATPTQLGPDVFQINNRQTEEGLILSGKKVIIGRLLDIRNLISLKTIILTQHT